MPNFGSFAPLARIDVDTSGWSIPLDGLQSDLADTPYAFDTFVESEDERYACLMYTIVEYRTLAYGGYAALFENKESPRLVGCSAPALLNTRSTPMPFIGRFYAFRGTAYHEDATLSGAPFVVVDLKSRRFGFIDVALIAEWYDLAPTENGRARLKPNEDMPDKCRPEATPVQEFDLAGIARFPLDQLQDWRQLFYASRHER